MYQTLFSVPNWMIYCLMVVHYLIRNFFIRTLISYDKSSLLKHIKHALANVCSGCITLHEKGTSSALKYCMSTKQLPILYTNLLYKMGHYFLDKWYKHTSYVQGIIFIIVPLPLLYRNLFLFFFITITIITQQLFSQIPLRTP